MDEKDELAGLRDIYRVFDDASEVMAAFLSAAASAELPTEGVIDAAHKTLGDLVEWRETLRELTRPDADAHDLH